LIATAGCDAADAELVAAVRAGDDSAFEELYRRYQPLITRFVCGMLRDSARCEDIAQEAFMSALRRMRATDAEINFKPWIYQIARNAAIDSYRRNNHAVEVSMDADDGLGASDRARLVGLDGSPDAALVTKERLDQFAEVVRAILEEAKADPEVARTAPHTTPVRRLDEAGAAKRPVVRWRPDG